MKQTIHNGMKVAKFQKGDRRNTVFSAERMNEIIDPLNCLLNMQIQRGQNEGVLIGDGKTLITLKSNSFAGLPGTPPPPPPPGLTTPSIDGVVYAFCFYPGEGPGILGSRIVAAGAFYHANGYRKSSICVFNRNATLDPTSWWFAVASTTINCVIQFSNTTLAVSGFWPSINEVTDDFAQAAAGNMMTLIANTGDLLMPTFPFTGPETGPIAFDCSPRWPAKSGGGSAVQWLAAAQGSRLYCCGTLDSETPTNDVAAGGVLSYRFDGQNCVGFPFSTHDVQMIQLAGFGGTALYACGNFTSYNGTGINSQILRILTASQTIDPGWNFSALINGLPRAIYLLSSGKVFVGGQFTTYGGVARSGIMLLNSDGTLYTGFQPGTGLTAPTHMDRMTELSDGSMLISGDFSTYNGVARNGIAIVHPDGSLDNFNVTQNGRVNCHIQHPDGTIWIGGSFGIVNGVTRNSIALLNRQGQVLGP